MIARSIVSSAKSVTVTLLIPVGGRGRAVVLTTARSQGQERRCHPPTTTVSPDLVAVHDLHVSLRLADWRAGLQALLA
jgi:hypothetical protein